VALRMEELGLLGMLGLTVPSRRVPFRVWGGRWGRNWQICVATGSSLLCISFLGAKEGVMYNYRFRFPLLVLGFSNRLGYGNDKGREN